MKKSFQQIMSDLLEIETINNSVGKTMPHSVHSFCSTISGVSKGGFLMKKYEYSIRLRNESGV